MGARFRRRDRPARPGARVTLRTGARVARVTGSPRAAQVIQGGPTGRGTATTAMTIARKVVVTSLPPETPPSRINVGREKPPGDFVKTSSAGRTPLGRREGQPGPGELPGLHRQPGTHLQEPKPGSVEMAVHGVNNNRARVHRTPARGPPAARPFSDGRDSRPSSGQGDPSRPRATTIMSCSQGVPSALETEETAPRGTRKVRRPGDRPPTNESPRKLQGGDPAPRTCRGPYDWRKDLRADRRANIFPRRAVPRHSSFPPRPAPGLRRIPHPVPGMLLREQQRTHAGGGVCGHPRHAAAKAAISGPAADSRAAAAEKGPKCQDKQQDGPSRWRGA